MNFDKCTLSAATAAVTALRLWRLQHLSIKKTELKHFQRISIWKFLLSVCVCVGGGVCLCVLFCCRQLAAQVFVGGSSRRGSLAAAAVFDALPHFKLELKVCCCYCSMRWLTTQHARFPFPPYPLRVRSSLCLCFFASALFMQNCLRLRPLSPSRWLSQSLG